MPLERIVGSLSNKLKGKPADHFQMTLSLLHVPAAEVCQLMTLLCLYVHANGLITLHFDGLYLNVYGESSVFFLYSIIRGFLAHYPTE